MDLRDYYQKLRDAAAGMAGEYVVVVSHATPDGGKAGVRMEVSRTIGAQLIVEGRARLASEEEAEEYRREVREAKMRADKAAAVERMQIRVISDAEIRALREHAKQRS